MTPLIEQLRNETLDSIFRLKGFDKKWPQRSDRVRTILGTKTKRRDVVSLGNSLSDLFRLGAAAGRGQADLSMAGSTWESLVVWYLNLCLIGTRAVVVRGAPLCPEPVKDALSICFENSVLRSEPDVVLISSQALMEAPSEPDRASMLRRASEILEESFGGTGVVNFQCKTNWNDNAQIPMLWNMLYNQARKGAVIPNGFAIGRNGFSLKNLGMFGYAFATVPTQKKGPEGYKPNNLDVMRVKTMSAGNYWGHPTRNGVCFSIGEFFNFFNRNSAVFPNVADVGKIAASAVADTDWGGSRLGAFRLGSD